MPNGTRITKSTTMIDGNLEREYISTTFIPSTLVREIRLVELSILFGVIGSSIHALTSLTMWHSRNKLKREFYSWYLTRPLIGLSLTLPSWTRNKAIKTNRELYDQLRFAPLPNESRRV